MKEKFSKKLIFFGIIYNPSSTKLQKLIQFPSHKGEKWQN